MAYHKRFSEIVDPELLSIWEEINRDVFEGSLKKPVSLIWKFDLRTYGGLCQYPDLRSDTVGIAIRGQLKGSPNEVKQVMVHEMVHQFCYQEWHRLKSIFYSDRRDMTSDNSTFFKYWLTWAACKIGTTYADLAYYDTKYVDNNVSLTQSAYEATKEVNSMLINLFAESNNE